MPAARGSTPTEPSAAKAQVDLDRLFDFVLEAEQALLAIRSGVATLKASPFTCRKVGQSPFLRELIIPFGRSGYVALFEIVANTEVVVSAMRHQLEEDFH